MATYRRVDWMTYSYLRADCLYTGIRYTGPTLNNEYRKPLPFFKCQHAGSILFHLSLLLSANCVKTSANCFLSSFLFLLSL